MNITLRDKNPRYQVKTPCGAALTQGTTFLLTPNSVDSKPLEITNQGESTHFHFKYTVWHMNMHGDIVNVINGETVD